MNSEERLELARDLKKSLESQLGEIRGIHIGVEHMGNAVLWSYGNYNGKIPIIGKSDNGTVILNFPQSVEVNKNGSYHSISSMRIVVGIWDRIESYLSEHGERQDQPTRDPTYYLREGIPKN